MLLLQPLELAPFIATAHVPNSQACNLPTTYILDLLHLFVYVHLSVVSVQSITNTAPITHSANPNRNGCNPLCE
jgi:hypothetical protein